MRKGHFMSLISKRQFLQMVGAGAASLGLYNILGASGALAAAQLPDWAALPEGSVPVTGGKLVYGQTYPNWDLGTSANGKNPYYFIDLLTRSIWNPLVWIDHDFNMRGELATSWAPTDDTLTKWDFQLREGVVFHNGQDMTSADVVASMQAHMERKGSGFVNKWIESIEALGPHAVRFNLLAPYAEFPYVLAEYRLVIFPTAAPDLIGNDGIGTGPYKLLEIDNKRGFKAVRNENYWIAGRPFVDEIEGYIVTSQAAVNGMRAGQFNAVFNVDPTTADQYESAGALIHRSRGGDQFLLSMPKNMDMAWNDVRVRKALTLSIDRDAINAIIYKDPGSWVGNDTHMSGLNAEFLPRAKPYDIEEAKRLLAEAGHPEGITLPSIVYCPSFPEEPRIMAIVVESVKKAVINLELKEISCDGFSAFGTAVNAPIGRPRHSVIGPRSPAINMGRMEPSTNPGESGGWTGPKAEEYAVLYKAAVGESDEKKRFQMYQDLQRIAQDDVPAILLGGRRNMLAHSPKVKNLRSHSQNWSTRFDDFWIES
jgi:peptide/nickel transport system substrate-binding protein